MACSDVHLAIVGVGKDRPRPPHKYALDCQATSDKKASGPTAFFEPPHTRDVPSAN